MSSKSVDHFLFVGLLLAPLILGCENGPEYRNVEELALSENTQALVNVTSFSAHYRVGWALVAWITDSETDCAGFNLFRAPTGEDTFVQVNDQLIPAKSASGASYEYEDRPLASGTYDYQLTEVDNNGTITTLGEVTVTVFGKDEDDRSAANCAMSGILPQIHSPTYLIFKTLMAK